MHVRVFGKCGAEPAVGTREREWACAKPFCSLKIHLHRWIIIKACYYIRNMKLKRPSGANEYDQIADIDGEGLVSCHH